MKNNQKKILRFISLLFVFITMTLPTISALAQSGLQLSAKRMFGLGIGSMVYTRMVLNVSGPADLKSVTFLIDGQVMAEVQTSPFKHSFHTNEFSAGWHELSAQGQTESGALVSSNVLRFLFPKPNGSLSGSGLHLDPAQSRSVGVHFDPAGGFSRGSKMHAEITSSPPLVVKPGDDPRNVHHQVENSRFEPPQ